MKNELLKNIRDDAYKIGFLDGIENAKADAEGRCDMLRNECECTAQRAEWLQNELVRTKANYEWRISTLQNIIAHYEELEKVANICESTS